jgi:hypothetical protein
MVIHLTNWPWALMVTVIERHRHHGAVPDLDRGGDFPSRIDHQPIMQVRWPGCATREVVPAHTSSLYQTVKKAAHAH